MHKIFHFDSPPEPYVADAAVLCCFDERIRLAVMRLHQTARVFLMSHSDCATYGGLEAFDGDRKREAEHHQHELQRAAELVKANFPALTVRCFFVGFDGIHGADAHEIGQAA